MIRKLFVLLKKHKIEIILYPFLLLYRMPVAWVKSLWESRVLLKGNWNKYMGFHPLNSINSLFYRTQWLNLKFYGRRGRSNWIGLGDYPLRNWFHISYVGSFLYANAAPVITLIGVLFWSLAHFVWMTEQNFFWCFSVSCVLLLSSTSYAMAFARQNYQILGWMFIPFALFFINSGNLIGASLAFVLSGMGALTPIFFAIPITVFFSLQQLDLWLLFTLVPSLTMISFRLFPLLASQSLFKSFMEIAKLIGLSSKEVRYSREMNRVSSYTFYFLIIYTVGTLVLYFATKEVPTLAILGIFALVINQRIARVADEESMILLFLSFFAFHAIQHENNWFALASLWIVASPLPIFLTVQEHSLKKKFGKIIVNAPFDHSKLESRLEEFFSAVRKGDSVYFAFSNPKGKYSNIFDGYRHIFELPLYVASKNKFHLLPDWWAVSETNYVGAPNCWGRSLKEVSQNMKRWNAKFSVIYQDSGTDLEEKWLMNYELLSSFDWQDFISSFRGVNMWSEDLPTPKWFLLKATELSTN